MAKVCQLYSGSSGNSIYIGTNSGGVLVDIGVSAKKCEAALNLFCVADSLNVSVCTEFKVNLIRVINSFLSQVLAYKLGQIAAHLIGK